LSTDRAVVFVVVVVVGGGGVGVSGRREASYSFPSNSPLNACHPGYVCNRGGFLSRTCVVYFAKIQIHFLLQLVPSKLDAMYTRNLFKKKRFSLAIY